MNDTLDSTSMRPSTVVDLSDQAHEGQLGGPARPPIVSVIIPAYNGGDRLRAAVASVVGQTFCDWELVVVDDGGNEDLSWLPSVDRRVRLERKPNGGVSSARNYGIDISDGEYIAFLDQDDRWLPQKLALQIEGFRTGDVMSHTDFYWCMPEPLPGRHSRPVSRISLLKGGHFCLSSMVVRRSALNLLHCAFDRSLAIQQDWELGMRLLDRGTASHIGVSLVEYNVHDDNASRDYYRAYQERMSVLKDAPRSPRERLASIRGMVGARKLYGSQAWASFIVDRTPRDLWNAVRWSPSTVIHGAALTIHRRIRSRSNPPSHR